MVSFKFFDMFITLNLIYVTSSNLFLFLRLLNPKCVTITYLLFETLIQTILAAIVQVRICLKDFFHSPISQSTAFLFGLSGNGRRVLQIALFWFPSNLFWSSVDHVAHMYSTWTLLN